MSGKRGAGVLDLKVGDCIVAVGGTEGSATQSSFSLSFSNGSSLTIYEDGTWDDAPDILLLSDAPEPPESPEFLPVPGHEGVELASCAVTAGEYAAFAELPVPENPDLPAVRVSWREAVAYCEAHGWRLPTEEEWVAAAGEPPAEGALRRCAHFSSKGPVAVDAFPTEPHRGFYQLRGNVYEWTATGRGPFRVCRGGSWASDARNCRAAYRSWDLPGRRLWNLGFRVARDV